MHGAVEQDRFLKHQGDLSSKRRQRVLSDVAAVDPHAASGRVVEARQQAGDGRFAGTGCAYKSDHLARLDVEADVGERRPPIAVGEPDVLDLDVTPQPLRLACSGQVAHRALDLQHREDPLETDRRTKHDLGDFGQVAHGLVEHGQIGQVHQQLTWREAAGEHLVRAVPEHHRGANRHHHVDQRRQRRL